MSGLVAKSPAIPSTITFGLIEIMKTDDVSKIGKHAFELAGLGLAPFRFHSLAINKVTCPDGTSKLGGSCDYCGTAIVNEFRIVSADGKVSKVGCDCIAKVGDKGLLKSYRSSPEFRAAQALKRHVKATETFNALLATLTENVEKLKGLPHPRGFTDRATGKPLTAWEYAEWMFNHCGHSGRSALLKWLNRTLAS